MDNTASSSAIPSAFNDQMLGPAKIIHKMMLTTSSESSSTPPVASLMSRPKISSWSFPDSRSPLLRPGATFRSRLLSVDGSPETMISSRPPGKKGTYPDFPRTKFCAGAGARLIEVEVRPVASRLFGVYNRVLRVRATGRYSAAYLAVSHDATIQTGAYE